MSFGFVFVLFFINSMGYFPEKTKKMCKTNSHLNFVIIRNAFHAIYCKLS